LAAIVGAHVAEDDVPGVAEENCVRASHVLLALGIAYLVALACDPLAKRFNELLDALDNRLRQPGQVEDG
jgi:hypothetical protein